MADKPRSARWSSGWKRIAGRSRCSSTMPVLRPTECLRPCSRSDRAGDRREPHGHAAADAPGGETDGRRSGGSIMSISSIIGLRGYAGLAVYSATKGGLDAMTRALARELGPRNIRVNSIAPGYLETEMTHGFGDDAARSDRAADTAGTTRASRGRHRDRPFPAVPRRRLHHRASVGDRWRNHVLKLLQLFGATFESGAVCLAIFASGHLVGSASVSSNSILPEQTLSEAGATIGLNSSRLA